MPAHRIDLSVTLKATVTARPVRSRTSHARHDGGDALDERRVCGVRGNLVVLDESTPASQRVSTRSAISSVRKPTFGLTVPNIGRPSMLTLSNVPSAPAAGNRNRGDSLPGEQGR